MFKKLLIKLGIFKVKNISAKSIKEQQKDENIIKTIQQQKATDQFYEDMETGLFDDDF